MNKDKIIVLTIILGFILFSVVSWFPSPEVKDFVRTGIGVTLCIFLFLGQTWSRWVMGVLSGLALLVGVTSLVSIDAGSILSNPILVVMCAFYSYAAFMLLNTKLLKSHFGHGLP